MRIILDIPNRTCSLGLYMNYWCSEKREDGIKTVALLTGNDSTGVVNLKEGTVIAYDKEKGIFIFTQQEEKKEEAVALSDVISRKDRDIRPIANYLAEKGYLNNEENFRKCIDTYREEFEFVASLGTNKHQKGVLVPCRHSFVLAAVFAARLGGVPEDVLSEWYSILVYGNSDKPYAAQVRHLRDNLIKEYGRKDFRNTKDFTYQEYERITDSIYNYWQKNKVSYPIFKNAFPLSKEAKALFGIFDIEELLS